MTKVRQDAHNIHIQSTNLNNLMAQCLRKPAKMAKKSTKVAHRLQCNTQKFYQCNVITNTSIMALEALPKNMAEVQFIFCFN
jgi:hypothetical protein